MKLVDILARELKAWPEESHELEQNYDLKIFSRESFKNPIILSELADDWLIAVVTRAEWQAAVDALNAPKVVEWDGAGLPPVGAVVDTDHKNKEIRVKILAYGAHHGGASCVLAADMSHGREGKMFGWMSDQCNFRAVRTAEQVSAEERENAIRDMSDIGIHASGRWAEAIYDAGYRKEPKPCGS